MEYHSQHCLLTTSRKQRFRTGTHLTYQRAGALQIELSLSQHFLLIMMTCHLPQGGRADRAISLNTFSLPRWHVTYHREDSRHSPYNGDTSLATGRTPDTFSLPRWHITCHREDTRHFLLTTVTRHLPQGGHQTLSPYHGDTSLTTGGTPDTVSFPQWHVTYHRGERGCGHFPGTSPRGGCRVRWCRTSSRTRPPSHQSAPGPCRPGCPPQWPRRSGLCSCDPPPPTSCPHERRWGSPSADKGETVSVKALRITVLDVAARANLARGKTRTELHQTGTACKTVVWQ